MPNTNDTPSPTPASVNEWLILSFAEAREQRKALAELIEKTGEMYRTVTGIGIRIERLEAWQVKAAPIIQDMDRIRRNNIKLLAIFTTIGTVVGYLGGLVSESLKLFPIH